MDMKFIFALLLFTGCFLPTSLDEIPIRYEIEIRMFFREAQNRLDASGVTDALDVPISVVHKWVPHPAPFYCDGVYAWGCWSSRKKRIEFDVGTIHVLIHESKHAILDALNHPCKKTVGHKGYPECKL